MIGFSLCKAQPQLSERVPTAYRPPLSWQEPVSQWRCARQRLSPVAPHGRLELTSPGFVHDLGSAVHPMALASPFFSTLPLTEYGLNWISPSAELAHPLDDGTAVTLEREIGDTACQLGTDAVAYRRLYTPLLERWDALRHDLLKPIIGWPQHPVAMARFGLLALRSARAIAHSHFKGVRARALFAGLGAHSFLPLESPISASFGLVLGVAAHAVGWPIPQGGAQSIADALVTCLRKSGGTVTTNAPVQSLRDLGDLKLLDVTTQAVSIPGRRGHPAVLPPPTAALPLRSRRVQGGLGP